MTDLAAGKQRGKAEGMEDGCSCSSLHGHEMGAYTWRSSTARVVNLRPALGAALNRCILTGKQQKQPGKPTAG